MTPALALPAAGRATSPRPDVAQRFFRLLPRKQFPCSALCRKGLDRRHRGTYATECKRERAATRRCCCRAPRPPLLSRLPWSPPPPAPSSPVSRCVLGSIGRASGTGAKKTPHVVRTPCAHPVLTGVPLPRAGAQGALVGCAQRRRAVARVHGAGVRGPIQAHDAGDAALLPPLISQGIALLPF